MAAFPSTASLIGVVQNFEGSDINRAKKWFPTVQTLGNVYEFDILYGNRTKADYRAPEAPAGMQALTRKVRKRVTLPTLREKKRLSEATMRWQDGAGKQYPERAMEAVARELRDLDDIIERTTEYARWQMLTKGKIILTGDYNETYDFGYGSTSFASAVWSDATNSDPINDIIAMKRKIQHEGGLTPHTILMGSAQLKQIFQSAKALALMGEGTKDQYRATGSVGQIAGMKVEIVDDGFIDSNGDFSYYLNSDDAATAAETTDCVLLIAGDKVGETVEGSVVDSQAPDGHIGKFAKSWEQEDPTGRWVLEAHTCLPGLTHPNRVARLDIDQTS